MAAARVEGVHEGEGEVEAGDEDEDAVARPHQRALDPRPPWNSRPRPPSAAKHRRSSQAARRSHLISTATFSSAAKKASITPPLRALPLHTRHINMLKSPTSSRTMMFRASSSRSKLT